MKEIFFIIIITVLHLAGVSMSAEASRNTLAPRVVQDLWHSFLQSKVSLDDQQKEAFVQQSLKDHFDFETMYQEALQDHWHSWTETQKKEFTTCFEALFIRNLYQQIKKIHPTKVSLTAVEWNQNGDKSTQYFTVEQGDNTFSFKVFFIKRGDTWKIYDEEIEGALLSRNYRGQFNRILRTKGFQGLLSRMNEQQINIEGV